MSNNNSTSSGIGFTSLLLLTFIILKLCNVITWSWWWVLSPAWISVGLSLLVLGGLGVWYLIKGRGLAKDAKKRMEKLGGPEALKSKWQQRLEEVQKARGGKL